MDFKKDLRWIEQEKNVIPEGKLLVAVEKNSDIDYGVVIVDDDGTLRDAEYGDVWTAWEWEDVNWYIVLGD